MRYGLVLISALIAVQFTLAEVVVFRNYETDTYLGSGSLHIERKIILQNVGSNPIIPGELHFKLHELAKGQKLAPAVSGFAAKNDLNVVLKTRQVETKEETDLVVSVWEPVLPKFTYNVMLGYDLKFKNKGILFYEMRIPLEETTIPIKDQRQSLFIPAKYHVTYAPNADVRKVEKSGETYRQVTWVNREDMVVEYSLIPLPKLGIRAVNVFWVVLILMIMLITFFIHRRMRGH